MKNFFVFLLILFMMSALLRVDFFFTILYFLAGIYILSTMWARRMVSHLHVSRTFTQRAYLGDEITVTLKVENRSFLPIPWLVINESIPIELSSPPFYRQVMSLGGKAHETIQYNLSALQRGYYNIGPLQLQTGDLFGINRQLSTQFESNYLIIYPKIVPISQLGLPTHSPHTILPTITPLFQDTSRIIGVRHYHQGDNPRHIHWPATAATGQLVVKQFQHAIARDNAIFLNLNRADYEERGYPEPAIELAITVAASLANHVTIIEELPIGLITMGFDPLTQQPQKFKLPPRKGRGYLMQILEVLARVQRLTDETNFFEFVRQEAVHLSWGTTVIIITSHATESLVQTMAFLKRFGFLVTVFFVEPAAVWGRSKATQQANLNIPAFKIYRETDIERVRSEQ